MDAGAYPYHLSQLAILCRQYPAEEKVVFVPSRQIGHNLGTALVRAGFSWVNLRLTTPAGWAERLVGASLRDEGLRPLVQDADVFFMIASVREAPGQSGVAATGIAKTLLQTIRSLRLAGIEPADMPPSESEAGAMLARQYDAYCDWLEMERLYDRAMLFRRAAAEVLPNGTVYAALDETPLPELAFELVRTCGEARLLRVGRKDWGAPPPEHSAGSRFAAAPFVSDGGYVAPGGRLRTDGLTPNDGDSVCLRTAIGVENEVRGVLREVAARGIALDEVEIAYTSENPYLSLLVEESQRLGLAATFAAGVPVTYTRPGQALLGFLRWVASGFDPQHLVRLFRSRLIFFGSETRPLDAAGVGGMLLEARIGRGRHGWRDPFARYVDRFRDRLESVDSESARRYVSYRYDVASQVKRHLGALYGLCPSDDAVNLRTLCLAATEFLERFAAWQGDRDKRARESLGDRLRDLGEGVSMEGTPGDLAGTLAELLEDHKVEAAAARPGHLHVVPLDRAGYAGRSETIIVGMAETTFPGPALEDPILLDAARERYRGRLKLQRARVNEPAFHLVRAMGMAAGRVVLTANSRDISDGREVYPAALFEQAKEQLGQKHLHGYAPIPDASDAATATEAALALRHTARTRTAIESEFSWLESGRRAVEARASEGIGVYDGWLEQETPDLKPHANAVLSASRLEDLAACPYRYFLKNVLRVRPPDVPEEMPGKWLTPLEFGSLLHEVLRAFMEQLAERRERVDAEKHAELMSEILGKAVERYREHTPVQFEAGYRADRHRLQRAVRVFLAEESRRGARPVGFEVSFGMGRTGDLDVPEPIDLKLDGDVVLSLRGSIDRVDLTDDGYEVWDYKTGSTYDFEEYDLLSGGRRLQWALYAYVLEDLLRRSGVEGAVRRSGYFFTSDREHGLRLSQEPPARSELARRLNPLFDLVGKGAFLHVQKSNACTFCDYAEICASERKEQKQIKDAVAAGSSEQAFVQSLTEWMECDA